MKPKIPVIVTGETQNIPTTYFFPHLTKEYYAEMDIPFPIGKDELPTIDALTFMRENPGSNLSDLQMYSYLGDTQLLEQSDEYGGMAWFYPGINLKMKTQILSPNSKAQILIPKNRELVMLALTKDAPEYAWMYDFIDKLKVLLAQNTRIFLPSILSKFENQGFVIDPNKLYMDARNATIFLNNPLQEKFPQPSITRFPIYPDTYSRNYEGYFLETVHGYGVRYG